MNSGGNRMSKAKIMMTSSLDAFMLAQLQCVIHPTTTPNILHGRTSSYKYNAVPNSFWFRTEMMLAVMMMMMTMLWWCASQFLSLVLKKKQKIRCTNGQWTWSMPLCFTLSFDSNKTRTDCIVLFSWNYSTTCISFFMSDFYCSVFMSFGIGSL